MGLGFRVIGFRVMIKEFCAVHIGTTQNRTIGNHCHPHPFPSTETQVSYRLQEVGLWV